MKRTLLIPILLLTCFAQAQPPVKKTKYPSLLWEISGNGLKKPSYLFGTMHVSSKMAFHLADSFYIGLRNADIVALETNPESWQEDMSKYDVENREFDNYDYSFRFNGYLAGPDDYLTVNTLRFYKYNKKIERTLYSNPSTINNLLYRTYGNESSDFEEDTYLDMYIYQCGKKWGKKVAGVEKYGESMKLMAEAYRDAARDKNKRERSYDAEEGYSSGNLQEAYRTGNLDWLDSINRYNSFSHAFDEKFLYRRNEIQAGSIDSILKTGQSLFVGVGAAHLPGTRGVIEMLRDKGYRVRPVKMGERDSRHKTQVEKLRVPVSFSSQAAEDGMYKVDIPGKFYKFGDDPALEQLQYADMANGSYYMVTRIMTNAWMWGHNMEQVYRVADSLLYENIPGRIISKSLITRNGYKGIDITNRTRRGDVQRYHIFITPFEIIVFKMSGTGDYVQLGDEAKKFFGSIQLKEIVPQITTAWKKYSPDYGGFSVSLPHDPYVGNDGSWIFDSEDKTTNTHYRVVRTDIHNHRFVEEDSFDLGLLEESFASSEFIDKQLSRQRVIYKGYPALDVSYKDKNGSIYLARFLIQGPHYYTLIAHSKQETAAMKNFLNSFELRPYIYTALKEKDDSSLYYRVSTPVFPEPEKEKLDIPRYGYQSETEEDESEQTALENGINRGKIIANDSTGEKIFVSFYKMHPYAYLKDSTLFTNQDKISVFGDTSWIIRSRKQYELPDRTMVREIILSDTGSSRTLWSKSFFRDGIGHMVVTQSDTLSQPSEFIRSFFNSFTPADTLKGFNPFQKKSNLFFNDFMSMDTAVRQRAIKGIYLVTLDSTDIPALKKIIGDLNWNEKKYLDTKKALIGKLDNIPSRQASDYLKELYYAAGDTLELQHTALEVMLQQKTKYAFGVFRDIISNEPPILSLGTGAGKWPTYQNNVEGNSAFSFDNGNFMDELYDSLTLTRTILPELLPLLNLDDYKYGIMRLLGRMADSKLVTAKDYDIYFNKFILEAKQELKKQAIAEKKKAIEKAEKEKENRKEVFAYDDVNKDYGNERLSLYATLLLPFSENKPGVQPVINQMLSSYDKTLKYRTLLLLLRNNKAYPDSMLTYFGSLDEYRYQLYNDLKRLGKLDRFPVRFHNQSDLAKSKLRNERSYGIPDSLVFIDKLEAQIKGRKGYVHFYKYKNKKDDVTWKIATVGLLPQDTSRFEFDETGEDKMDYFMLDENFRQISRFDFTKFTDTRIKPDQPLADQLVKELRKLLYSRKKSAKEFYNNEPAEAYEEVITVEEN